MWENAYLSIENQKASRALTWALDPGHILLASLRWQLSGSEAGPPLDQILDLHLVSPILYRYRASRIPDQETNIRDNYNQGGHGTGKTGKTGNLVLTFSRQGKHREFCFDTGKNFETQGKYFSVTQGKI